MPLLIKHANYTELSTRAAAVPRGCGVALPPLSRTGGERSGERAAGHAELLEAARIGRTSAPDLRVLLLLRGLDGWAPGIYEPVSGVRLSDAEGPWNGSAILLFGEVAEAGAGYGALLTSAGGALAAMRAALAGHGVPAVIDTRPRPGAGITPDGSGDHLCTLIVGSTA
ncbi:hypothetical protein [Streptomyces sp. NPDC020965]|uniref:hypothetical protein n=1 Tax=Streptomyces sp. NPDC020965 TaxID=3365105 RepID=UPI003799AE41